MHWVTDCFCICKKNRSSLACGWAKQLSVLQVNSIFLHFGKWVQALLCFSVFLLINNEVNSTLCFMVWELFFGRRAQGYFLSPWIIPTFCAAAFCEICYCFFSALNMHDGLPKLTSVCMYVHECLCVCLTGSPALTAANSNFISRTKSWAADTQLPKGKRLPAPMSLTPQIIVNEC